MAEMLDRLVTIPSLQAAWRAVLENDGSSGGDGVSLARFARRLDEHVLSLQEDLRTGKYTPGKSRRVHVQFGAKRRTLDILPVRDRVLQRAALDELTATVDATFLPSSYGYRPGRSLHDAVRRIVRLRNRGLVWVVDADIADCFPNLDHYRLLSFVRSVIPDKDLINLIGQWIGSDGATSGTTGISLGAPISPMLCNIYLHHLDAALHRRRYHMVRYADDFVILCGTEERASRALVATERILTGIGLTLNDHKTRITSFDEGFDYLGVHFERDRFTYETQGKRITVEGEVPRFLHELPDGYR